MLYRKLCFFILSPKSSRALQVGLATTRKLDSTTTMEEDEDVDEHIQREGPYKAHDEIREKAKKHKITSFTSFMWETELDKLETGTQVTVKEDERSWWVLKKK